MKVIHVLKDGTRLEEISGHVVKGLPEFYRILNKIRERNACETDRSCGGDCRNNTRIGNSRCL